MDEGLDLATELRHHGDELRAVATMALAHPCEDEHHRHHFERVRRIGANVFAMADVRTGEEIERTVFTGLTHIAPVAVVDAATIDDAGRMLLIRRADDG